MVFSSLLFLFAFLPAFLLLFYALPRAMKKPLVLLASLTFYFWGEDVLVWILIASTSIDYVCGLLIAGAFRRGVEPRKLARHGRRTRRQKVALAISICSNMAFLGYFKYVNFFVDNVQAALDAAGFEALASREFTEIALPLGISFYSFQSMSYTIDVYRGIVRPTRNLLNFATYVTMFPQLVAGPIVRYRDVEKQLIAHRLAGDEVAMGMRRFVLGLVKKVLIANTVSTLADGVFDAIPAGELTLATSWAGVLAYTLQIYFDFSGYSDMAIGLGMMLGFRFLENFRFPYVAQSVKEFWRRWHISLSTWFRDYLYIPLGGSRGGAASTYRNLLIVFVLCGLWHGAEWTFVIWGLYHGVFLVLERQGWFARLLERAPRPLRHGYLLAVVMVGWVFFRAASLERATAMLEGMVGLNGLASARYPLAEHLSMKELAALVGGAVFSAPIYPALARRFAQAKARWRWRPAVELAESVAFTALLGACAVLLSSGAANPFLYFRF